MSLNSAFGALLSIHSRTMTLTRPGGVSVSIKATPSNYFRNLAGPEEVTFEGKEFIISKAILDGSGFTLPIKKGDRLVDTQMGSHTVQEIREIFDIGAAIMGYRIRTN